jgi:hypothetical protein
MSRMFRPAIHGATVRARHHPHLAALIGFDEFLRREAAVRRAAGRA